MRILLAVLVLASSVATASAACRPGTNYKCFPTANGKMMCGCY